MLRAAMLDLGDTLVHLDKPWDDVFRADLEALYGYLQEQGLNLEFVKFARKFIREFEAASAVSDFFKIEIPMQEIIARTLQAAKFRGVDTNFLQKAMEEFYRPEITSWVLYSDTVHTLNELKDHGLQMGLISNAKSDWFVHETLRTHDLEKFFQIIVSSAGLRIRKPRADIFLSALKPLGIRPEEVVFIGDSLQADMLGAKIMGMRSVHLNRRPSEDQAAVDPDVTVGSLTDALAPILAWKKQS